MRLPGKNKPWEKILQLNKSVIYFCCCCNLKIVWKWELLFTDTIRNRPLAPILPACLDDWEQLIVGGILLWAWKLFEKCRWINWSIEICWFSNLIFVDGLILLVDKLLSKKYKCSLINSIELMDKLIGSLFMDKLMFTSFFKFRWNWNQRFWRKKFLFTSFFLFCMQP